MELFTFIGMGLTVIFIAGLFRPVKLDHVNYISGGLGAGKTSLAVWLAVTRYRKREAVIISNFQLEGVPHIPLDTTDSRWPRVRGAIIILDEMLQLHGRKKLQPEWFAEGLTMARQFEQTVLILSQTHLPRFMQAYRGTIGQFIVVQGISFGKLGRLIMVRRSAEQFERRKGYKGLNIVRSMHWVPGWAWKMYHTPLRIHGLWMPELEAQADDETARAWAVAGLPVLAPASATAPSRPRLPRWKMRKLVADEQPSLPDLTD
jgi:hypothetical protein